MAKTLEVKQTKTPSRPDLSRWNKWLALIYGVQGGIILTLSTTHVLPVRTYYQTTDPIATELAGHPIVGTAVHHMFTVNVAYVLAAFFAAAAITHLVLATIYRRQYEAGLRKRVNVLRWIEYGVSGGLIVAAVALLSGITNFLILLLIFVLTLVTALFAMALELYNQGKAKSNWLAYGAGGLSAVAVAAVFGLYVWSTLVYGDSALPGYLYGLYATLLVVGFGFAATMFLLQRKTGKWQDYYYGEQVYMALCLLAKTALAWQIFAGVLKP